MRRTGKTSLEPTIGMKVGVTAKIGFGPACAVAGAVAAPTPTAAMVIVPTARITSRLVLVIGVS